MVFGVRLWSTRWRIFLGDDSRNGFRIHHFWFDSGHMFGVSLSGFPENFTRFVRAGGLGSDPRDGPDDLRRAIFASFFGDFSHSVQEDMSVGAHP